MKIEHLDERVNDYKISIKSVVDKKLLWNTKTKALIKNTLTSIADKYDIGWTVQELSWMYNNEAVNIAFNSFPPELIDCTNQIPAYQFISGGALIFSQSYSGDVKAVILLPYIETIPNEAIDLGTFAPNDITEKQIIEMVDDFLKEMIKWDLPTHQNKLGFQAKKS